MYQIRKKRVFASHFDSQPILTCWPIQLCMCLIPQFKPTITINISKIYTRPIPHYPHTHNTMTLTQKHSKIYL